jgi:hypothetical protein
MENVLFDLYIAEAEIKENGPVFYSDSIRRQQLLHSVFEKHRISEQKFDTSLVWYNAHLDRYLKINEKLTVRYAALINNLQADIQRTNRSSNDTLKFSDLELKDFITPILTFHIQNNDSDYIRQDSVLKTKILPLHSIQ